MILFCKKHTTLLTRIAGLLICVLVFAFYQRIEFKTFDIPILNPQIQVQQAAKENQIVKVKYDVPMSVEKQEFVFRMAEKYSLDASVIFAIIQVESGFYEKADNGICCGLMQINRNNFGWMQKELGTTDLFDPYQNIECGCFIMHHLICRGYNLEEALVYYNTGDYGKSSHYSRMVLSCAENIREHAISYIIEEGEQV